MGGWGGRRIHDVHGSVPTSGFASGFSNLDVRGLSGRGRFALRFQVAVDGRRDGLGLLVRRGAPGRRGDGSVAKAHVGGRGDLPPQGGLVTCDGGGVGGERGREGDHGDVVGVQNGNLRRSRMYPGTTEEEFKPYESSKFGLS